MRQGLFRAGWVFALLCLVLLSGCRISGVPAPAPIGAALNAAGLGTDARRAHGLCK